MKKAGICLLVIICTACGLLDQNSITLNVTPENMWNSPMPIPAFLRGLADTTNENGEWASVGTCVVLNGPEIGSTSVPEGDTTGGILAHTVRISVNGSHTDDWVFASLSWFSPTVCFSHNAIGYGLHVAGIEFEMVSGKKYSYVWAFEIVEEEGKPSILYPDGLEYTR